MRFKIEGNNINGSNKNTMIIEEDPNVHNSMSDDSKDFKLNLMNYD